MTNELGSVMAKWFSIGVQLGIDPAKLQEIETNYRTADRCFSEVINFWLKGNTPVAVSWISLVGVLKSPFVNEKGLARRLEEKVGMIESVDVHVPAGFSGSSQVSEDAGTSRVGGAMGDTSTGLYHNMQYTDNLIQYGIVLVLFFVLAEPSDGDAASEMDMEHDQGKLVHSNSRKI